VASIKRKPSFVLNAMTRLWYGVADARIFVLAKLIEPTKERQTGANTAIPLGGIGSATPQ
jgi:hypothetical protein